MTAGDLGRKRGLLHVNQASRRASVLVGPRQPAFNPPSTGERDGKLPPYVFSLCWGFTDTGTQGSAKNWLRFPFLGKHPEKLKHGGGSPTCDEGSPGAQGAPLTSHCWGFQLLSPAGGEQAQNQEKPCLWEQRHIQASTHPNYFS